MNQSGNGSPLAFSRGYLKSRVSELTSPALRAATSA